MRNLRLNPGGTIGVCGAFSAFFMMKLWWSKNGSSAITIPVLLIALIFGVVGNFLWATWLG